MKAALRSSGVLVALLVPSAVSAHAFGQRYDLPVPLWLAMFTTISVVALTFVATSLILPEAKGAGSIDLSRNGFVRVLSRQAWIGACARAAAFGVFALAIATAAFGSRSPVANFAPTFFWINFWVGLPFLAFLFGNFWERITPWASLYRWIRAGRGKLAVYPTGWGVWPAVILYAIFTWFELVSDVGYFPYVLAILLVNYTLIQFAGSAVYGLTWVKHAEFFTVLSQVVGAASPLGYEDGRVRLRIPGTGLFSLRTDTPGLIPFVGVFLAGVSYDGFKETEAWQVIARAIGEVVPLPLVLIRTIEIVGVFAVFLGAYYLVMYLVRKLVRTDLTVRQLAQRFIISLVPIGIAYTLAHYLTFLLVTGQQIIPLLSDPFGTGADYLGTAGYRVNINLLSAQFVWYTQISIVALGHMLGVYIGHLVALRTFRDAKDATRSQYPMLLLMLGLTAFALWILSAQLQG